jgi:hypothetical protein
MIEEFDTFSCSRREESTRVLSQRLLASYRYGRQDDPAWVVKFRIEVLL